MFDSEYEYMWKLLADAYEKTGDPEAFKTRWDKIFQQMLDSSVAVIFGTKTVPEHATEALVNAVREELIYRIENKVRIYFPTGEHTEPAE